jgi:hypothetical protein
MNDNRSRGYVPKNHGFGEPDRGGVPVTERQDEIMEYIRAFRRLNGYSPTVREIGERFGINSPNGVMCHLVALARKGKIRRLEKTARSIVPIGETDCLRCPCCGEMLRLSGDALILNPGITDPGITDEAGQCSLTQ